MWAPGPRDPTETEPEVCLSVSCGGMGQQWPASGAGALGAADLGMAKALLEEVAINPTMELPELTQDWGNRRFEDTNRTLCNRMQEKGAVTPQKADPDLPKRVLGCPAVAWVSGGLLQGLGHSGQQSVHGTF